MRRGRRNWSFNPRPDRAAGATRISLRRFQYAAVSIRAPTVRPGRRHRSHNFIKPSAFQSAPRPCGRGDFFLQRPSPAWMLFQSAPRPCGRGDACSSVIARALAVSIRAPTVRPGRHAVLSPPPASTVVSIRAPTVRPGRPLALPRRVRSPEFQSAPRPCGRGDKSMADTGPRQHRFNPRPDRAAGATRAGLVIELLPESFNPRPDRAAGATIPEVVGARGIPRFNPRPDRAAGATTGMQLLRSTTLVSIRAPTVRPGRPAASPADWAYAAFQSAPRPCGRGDSRAATAASSTGCFNPRPDRAAGATDSRSCQRNSRAVSIRAPTARPGRQVHDQEEGVAVCVSIRAPTARPGRHDWLRVLR